MYTDDRTERPAAPASLPVVNHGDRHRQHGLFIAHERRRRLNRTRQARPLRTSGRRPPTGRPARWNWLWMPTQTPTGIGGRCNSIFRELPIAVALSVEGCRNLGSYKAETLMGRPLLVTRDEDGKAHAFLNVCRHRGRHRLPGGLGDGARAFPVPYHAWTYDLRGRLVGVYGAESFGDVDRESRPLTELHCEERSGLIWACPDPGHRFRYRCLAGRIRGETGFAAPRRLGGLHAARPGRPGLEADPGRISRGLSPRLGASLDGGAVHHRQPPCARCLRPAPAPDLRPP